MEKIHITKQKLSIFDIKGCYWLLIDMMRFFDGEVNGLGELHSDEFYAFYAKKLKYKYEKEIAEAPVENIQQIDLEESITEIKKENI